jgi:hypothetical protein
METLFHPNAAGYNAYAHAIFDALPVDGWTNIKKRGQFLNGHP